MSRLCGEVTCQGQEVVVLTPRAALPCPPGNRHRYQPPRHPLGLWARHLFSIRMDCNFCRVVSPMRIFLTLVRALRQYNKPVIEPRAWDPGPHTQRLLHTWLQSPWTLFEPWTQVSDLIWGPCVVCLWPQELCYPATQSTPRP